MMKAITALAFVGTLAAVAPAEANIEDGKPWDWDTLDSLVQFPRDRNGVCDAVASDNKAKDLKCQIDHKAWDAHLAKEAQKERLRDRNRQEPMSCVGGSFSYFRSNMSGGGYPDQNGEAVWAEFAKNVALMICTFDDTDKGPFATYDAAHRTMTFHLTRKDIGSPLWVKGEMEKPEIAKYFPALEHWFRAHS